MELFTGDRQIKNPNDFPHQITPFPVTANLLLPNPTALLHSPAFNAPNLPPQKLRPIRNGTRSPTVTTPPDEDVAPAMEVVQGVLEDKVCLGTRFEALKDGNGCGIDELLADSGRFEIGPGFLGKEGERSLDGGLLDDDFCSLDDDENSSASVKESSSQKRKRKSRKDIEEFMENLVMKVMEKQEEMQKQLIEMVEKKERERIIREDAWRQKVIEQIKKDEELRAEETSRNLAIISLIQNAMGHDFKATKHITQVSHGEVSSEQCTPVQNNFTFNSTNPNKRWPEAEVRALIMLRTSLDQKFHDMGSKSSSIWDEISFGMKNMGYDRTARKCKEKWENINKYFKRSLGSSGKKRYEDTKTRPYFQELNMLYKNGLVNSGVPLDGSTHENIVSSGTK